MASASASSDWQSELARLVQPAALAGADLESSRVRRDGGVSVVAPMSLPLQTEREPGFASASSFAAVCERCYTDPTSTYCPPCDATMCNGCDTRLHAVGSTLSSHARLHVGAVSAFRLECPDHLAASAHGGTNARLAFYCRTCARAVCNLCQAPGGVHGPGSGHVCVRLADEFAAQLEHMRRSVGSDAQVGLKKQALLHELRALDSANNSLRATSASVESQEAARAQQALHRLESIVQLNASRITSAIERARGDIRDIDSFLVESALVPVPPASASTSGAAPSLPSPPAAASSVTPASMCRFLSRMREWAPRAHELASRGDDESAAAAAADGPGTASSSGLALTPLPREAADRASALAQFPRLLALLRVKDELLRFAMAARKGLLVEQEAHATTLRQLYEQSQREMEEWMKLSESLASELRQLKAKCAFCDVPMSGAAASTPCATNTHTSQQQLQQHRSGSFEGSERREGDGLHFFVQG